jgi:hypothetical protein
MRVFYNKSSKPWSFFAFQPNQDGKANDFWGYTELVFWVYADKRVSLIAKVEDHDGRAAEEQVIVRSGEWNKVVVGLIGIDKRRVSNVLFFVEPGQMNVSGSLVIDFMCLVSRDLLAYIPGASLKVPKPLPPVELTPSTYELQWRYDQDRERAGLYEVWVDADPRFPHPVRYLTTEEHLLLSDVAIGSYHWKVRAWTHLPPEWGYWGQASGWSRSGILAVKPFKTVRILANFDGQDDAIETWWDRDGRDVYSRRITDVNQHAGSHSMLVKYVKTPGYEWSHFGFLLRQDGKVNDFSNYDQLSLWVYPEQENLQILLKIQDRDLRAWEQLKTAAWPMNGSVWTSTY